MRDRRARASILASSFGHFPLAPYGTPSSSDNLQVDDTNRSRNVASLPAQYWLHPGLRKTLCVFSLQAPAAPSAAASYGC
jgi:hypothetical protein